MPTERLKRDLFGEIRVESAGDGRVIVRDSSAAAWPLRAIARYLMRREAAALVKLDGIDGVPELLECSRDRIVRTYIEGTPLYEARMSDPLFYRRAMRLLRLVHARGVVHNDLAKEPNILVTPCGRPALIDFQVALSPRRRNRLFRIFGREDIRHLLKHKRTYCPQRLTAREKRILASPSLPARLNRRVYKPVYLFITRKILGWSDREGASDLRM